MRTLSVSPSPLTVAVMNKKHCAGSKEEQGCTYYGITYFRPTNRTLIPLRSPPFNKRVLDDFGLEYQELRSDRALISSGRIFNRWQCTQKVYKDQFLRGTYPRLACNSITMQFNKRHPVSPAIKEGFLELYPDEWDALPFDPTNQEKVTQLFDHYIANHMPTHLIYLGPDSKIKIVERGELAKFIKPRVPQGGEADKILSYQDVIRELIKPALEYAIFSHRWLREGEPKFCDIMKGNMAGIGFQKLSKFCEKAREMGYQLAWSDTSCIDKENSSTELDEAIQSMFRWYRNASICIVHLSESLNAQEMKNDPWFTRGWTLQELLAPMSIKFFNKNWSPICDTDAGPANDKNNDQLMSNISKITGIPVLDLRQFSPRTSGIRQKMAWASRRSTTRTEDAAYSLIGIIDVSMPTAYGEGERAFHRLMEIIIQRCDEWEMFAWSGPSSTHMHSTVIPRSPRCYGPFDTSNFPKELKDVQNMEAHGDRQFVLMRHGLQIRLIIASGKLEAQRSRTYKFVVPAKPGMVPSFAPVVVQTSHLVGENDEFALGIVNYERNQHQTKGDCGILYPQKSYLCFLLRYADGFYYKVNTSNGLTVRTTFQGWGSFEPLVTVCL